MISRFVVFVLFVGCLATPNRSKRSINGTKAIHMEITADFNLIKYPYGINYPYVIELLENLNHICGGALVRPNFALTARHCFPSYMINRIDFYVPKYFLIAGNQKYKDKKSSFVQVREVGKIVFSPQRSYRECDLAILKVTKPFDLNIHVNVVKIPLQNKNSSYYHKLTVNLGWGATGIAAHSDYLHKVYGYIKKSKLKGYIAIDGIFGGFVQWGDFGGPTVIQGNERKDDLLVGIMHGIEEKPRWYSVNLAVFANWINETIESM